MGPVGLLRFTRLCLYFLSWPAFALVYPMVPFWPYIKLIAICWMMIPRFYGACLVYQCLLHPCLSLNLKTVVNWFCWSKEKASIKDPFLTTVEHYLKENGSEALEKLILSKLLHSNVADAQEDMERVEPIQKNVVAEEQWVKHPQENLSKTDNKTSIAAEVPHVSMSAATEEKGPSEIPAVKQIQREWTCAVCQVTVTSEATLNSHLKGEKHKSKCAELKTVI